MSTLRAGVENAARTRELAMELGEYWFGGWSVDGPFMPYGRDTCLARNLYGGNGGNQAQPLLLSTRGRYIWSEKPFRFALDSGMLRITDAHAAVEHGRAGETLRDVFQHVAGRFFPADGRMPDPLMFSHPQYNTWIELMYDQNQRDILRYARAVREQGYPTGVLMIDDTWQEDYGHWDFSARRFPDPKAMMRELHGLGFKVMVWICPFVSPDGEVFRELEKKGLLVMEPADPGDKGDKRKPRAAVIRWWNGVSASLDFSHPQAREWFKARLDWLVREYGVDGFKFDAGDADFYTGQIASHVPALPNEHTERFAEIGLDFPLNEYRASWKMAGRPLAQRLRDKAHTWEDLAALVPGTIAQAMMGYAFTCPDLIGGGEYTSFLDGAVIDEELMVRATQVHALMPMMQFSAAPWRVLSPERNAICRRMSQLHVEYGNTFLALARHAAETGDPIVRPLCWQWPEGGYEAITDQFMLGDDILVAPVLQKGARARRIVFPPGIWQGDDGSVVKGPSTQEVAVPLARLPWYRREAIT